MSLSDSTIILLYLTSTDGDAQALFSGQTTSNSSPIKAGTFHPKKTGHPEGK
jgi:hypothetical protein